MNTPNHYQDLILEVYKDCLQDLISLFSAHGISELDVSEMACKDRTERAYCTIWDQYNNCNTEALVEKVTIINKHLSLVYSLDSEEYKADLEDIRMNDVLSIYETCYCIINF